MRLTHHRPGATCTVLIAICVVSGPWLGAWGRGGHFWISERALDSVGPELRQTLAGHGSELVRLSIDADERRRDDPDEGRRHYLDLDNYGDFPYTGFSVNRQALEQTWGTEWVKSQGTVLWVIERRYRELTEAFRSRKVGAIPAGGR